MNLGKQKKLASRALGISTKRIKFDTSTPEKKKDLKEVISREGVKDLVEEKTIKITPAKGNSRTRANYILEQKKKGRRSGHGNRKGTAKARNNPKDSWIEKIRSLRKLLKSLKDSEALDSKSYREYYKKAKGNFFRNKRHMLMYLQQNNILKTKDDNGGNKQ